MINLKYIQHIAENSSEYRYKAPTMEQLQNMNMNEATYYGKNQKLIKVESILDDMCKKSQSKGSYIHTTEFCDSMEEVADILAEVFGFKTISINNSVLNVALCCFNNSPGCTFVNCYAYKTGKALMGKANVEVYRADSSGTKATRFDSNSDISMRMIIHPNLFLDYGRYSMTGGEVLAIILHEIGHNFYTQPLKEIPAEFISYMDASSMLETLMTIAMSSTLNITEYVDRTAPKPAKRVIFQFTTLSGQVISFVKNATKIITAPFIPAMILLEFICTTLGPLRMIKAALGYDSEKYADAFCTAYGYAPQLSSALTKISHVRIPNMTPDVGIGRFVDLMWSMWRYFTSAIHSLHDEHPQDIQRLANNMRYLEIALERSDMSTRERAECKKQLQMLKNRLNELETQKTSLDGVEWDESVQAGYLKLFRITDWKELFSTIGKKQGDFKNLDFD